MRTIKRSVSLLLAILCIMSYTGEAFAVGLTDEVEPQDVLYDITSFEQNETSGLESAFETTDNITAEEIDVPETGDDVAATEAPVEGSDIPETGDDVAATAPTVEESDIPETGDDVAATEAPVEDSDVPETGDGVATTEAPVEDSDVPETGDGVAATETPVEDSDVPETGNDVAATESPAVESAMPGMKSSLKSGRILQTESLTPQAENVSDPEDAQDTSNPEDTQQAQDMSNPEDTQEAQNEDAQQVQNVSASQDTQQAQNVLDPEDPLYYELLDKIDVLVPLTTQTEEMEPLSAPFDFSVDPYGLIESTQAIRYGGGSVEPGARVVFRNRAGDYDFSSRSDVMSVRNRADSPIQITITVRYEDTENVRLVNAEELETDSLLPMLWIAVADSQGNRTALNPDGEVTIVTVLPACENESDIVAYLFRLEGNCNPNAVWHNVNIDASLSVIWSVSPVAAGTAMVEEPAIEDAPDTDFVDGEPPLLVAPNAYMAPAASMPDANVSKESYGTDPADEAGVTDRTEPVDEAGESNGTEPADEAGESNGTEPADEAGKADGAEDNDPAGNTSDGAENP